MKEYDETSEKQSIPLQSWVLFAFCSLPSSLILGIWFLKNQAYPSWDPADFFYVALKNYNLFIHSGWLAGLQGLFWERSWRPTMGGLLQFPAIVISGGHVLIAMPVFGLTFMLGLFVYTYSILRRSLSEFYTVLIFWNISLVPWVLQLGTDLIAELPYLTFMIAALDHFERSNGFQVRRHALLCGIFMGLAICTRPVEAFLIIGLAGIVYLCILGYQRFLDVTGALLLALTAAFPAAMICLYWNAPPILLTNPTIATVAVIAAITVIAWKRKNDRSTRLRELQFSISIACTISVIWLLPFLHDLKTWILENSIGTMANNGPWTTHENLLIRVLKLFGGTILIQCFFIVACELIRLTILRPLSSSMPEKMQKKGMWEGKGLIIAVLVLCIPTLIKCMFPNGLLRLHYVEAYLSILIGLRWYISKIADDKRFGIILTALLLLSIEVESCWDTTLLTSLPQRSSFVSMLPFSVHASLTPPLSFNIVENLSNKLLQLLPGEPLPKLLISINGESKMHLNVPGLQLFFLEKFHKDLVTREPWLGTNENHYLIELKKSGLHYVLIGPVIPFFISKNKEFRKIGTVNFIIYNYPLPMQLFYIQ